MFYVYILYSLQSDAFYKGQTKDLKSRMIGHNSGYEKSTENQRPWTLVWHTTKTTRSEAKILEQKLKHLGRKRTIDFILKYYKGIEGPDEALLIQRLSGLMTLTSIRLRQRC